MRNSVILRVTLHPKSKFAVFCQNYHKDKRVKISQLDCQLDRQSNLNLTLCYADIPVASFGIKNKKATGMNVQKI